MAFGLRLRWRMPVLGMLLASLVTGLPAAQADRRTLDAAPRISLVVVSPVNSALRYGVDAIEEVVRSTDSGASWTPVFSPGDAQAPDPSTPGACLPGNYQRVTFLAIDPLRPRGLYAGTDGVVGDYLDNGCGNAPGGLFYSANGQAPFAPINSGLPANADARGGGMAWGVQTIAFDPRDPAVLYVQTDPSFLAVLGATHPANPTEPGMYRTVDGGAQWDAAFGGIAVTPCQFGPCRYPGSLAIDPAQPDVLLLAASTGFYRSADRGAHWQLEASLWVGDRTHVLVRIDPYQPTLAYVATDRALYRSDDAGLHLTPLSSAHLPLPAQVVDINFQRTPPRVVYLLRDGRHLVVQDAGPSASATATETSIPTGTPTRVVPTASPSLSPTRTVTVTATPTATATKSRPRATPTASAPSATPTPIARLLPGNAAWPMAGHDVGQSFFDPVGGIPVSAVPRLHLRWSFGGVAPAIEAGTTVYALDEGGKVIALNAQTGGVRHRYLSVGVQSLAHDGHLLYFNRGTEIRYVDDKTADWHSTATDKQGNLAPAFGAIVVDGPAVYTGVGPQGSGSLARYYAFDARTGRMLWMREGSLSSVPCLAGRTLYLSLGQFGAADTYLLDPVTGAVQRVIKSLGTAQWHSSGGHVYASVLRGSGNNFTAFVNAYDLGGRLRWVAHDELFGAAQPDRFFGVTPNAIDARSAKDGHRIWKRTIPGQQSIASGAVVVAGNLLIVQAPNGRLTLLDAGSGRVLRVLHPPVPGVSSGNLIVGDGFVYESVEQKAAGNGHGAPTLLAFGL